MKKIQFTKMHGLGNCYGYINCFETKLEEAELPRLAEKFANVSTGIGSDGIILLCPSKKADIKMRIFNKDGSEAKNCGNGLRCVAKYAFDHSLVSSKKMSIETLGGIVHANIFDNTPQLSLVQVNMGHPQLERSKIPMNGVAAQQVVNESFNIDKLSLKLTAVSMGNPHAVFFTDTSKHSLHKEIGPKIEKDFRFFEGVNVEFVHVISPTSLHCSVWERGSGVTQACGTGACASAVAAILNGHSKKGEDITVHLEGGDLKIQWAHNNDVLMTGPAEYIASGTFIYG